MKKIIFSLIIISVAASCSNEEFQKGTDPNSLVSRTVLKDRLEITLPSTFTKMDEETLNLKYQRSNNRPTEVYSDTGTVSIAFKEQEGMPTKEEDLPTVLKVLDRDLERVNGLKWGKKKLTKINEQQYCLLEFVAPAFDTKIYNLMVASTLDGHLFIVSFNCPIELKKDWQDRANKMINSLKVRATHQPINW